MAAVVPSVIPISAKNMPYHRRSGAKNRTPVSVIAGVTDNAMSRQNSPPVPRTSASMLVRESFSFSDSHPRMMKIHGTNAGRRMKNSATDFLLIPGRNETSCSIQASRFLRLGFRHSSSSSAYSG